MLVCFYSIPLVHSITVYHCIVNINNLVFSFLFLCVVEKHQSVQIASAERPVGNELKAKTICGMSVLSAVLLGILAIVLIVFLVTIFIFLGLGVYFLK